MRELLSKINKINHFLINAPKGHFQEVWDKLDGIHYVDPAEEAEKELAQLLYKLGQKEEFIFLMTPEEKEVNQKMLKGINRSMCFEVAFKAEFEMRQKESWNETLPEVEREFSGELADGALDKLYEAEERTASYKKAYIKFIWDIYIRLDV